MAIGSLLLLFWSGGYLTARVSAWGLGWPKVAVASMVLIAPLGVASGRRMRAIRRRIMNQDARESALIPHVNSTFLNFSLAVRMWVIAGIVLLMAAKPDTIESVVIIVASAILGSLSALVGSRRVKQIPALGTNTTRAN